MNKLIPFEYGETYHVYNKSVGGVLLFKSSNDYFYFLKKLERYILPIADIYAYCLIPNHFHFLLKIKNLISNLTIIKMRMKQSGLQKHLVIFHKLFKIIQ